MEKIFHVHSLYSLYAGRYPPIFILPIARKSSYFNFLKSAIIRIIRDIILIYSGLPTASPQTQPYIAQEQSPVITPTIKASG